MTTDVTVKTKKSKGGRPLGSKQKSVSRVAGMIAAEFESRGTTLIQEMVDLAMTAEPRVRASMLLGMARFVYPQLTAVTIKNQDAPQTAFILNLGTETIEVKSSDLGHSSGHNKVIENEEPQS